MYKGVREFTTSVAPRILLDVVWEVAAYPEFVKGIKRVVPLDQGEGAARARFTAGLAGMDFEYVLKVERESSEVRWQRESGAFNDTGGRITHLGGERFRYEAWLDPGFHVPELAVRFVLERSLPRLIKDFIARAEARALGRV